MISTPSSPRLIFAAFFRQTLSQAHKKEWRPSAHGARKDRERDTQPADGRRIAHGVRLLSASGKDPGDQ